MQKKKSLILNHSSILNTCDFPFISLAFPCAHVVRHKGNIKIWARFCPLTCESPFSLSIDVSLQYVKPFKSAYSYVIKSNGLELLNSIFFICSYTGLVSFLFCVPIPDTSG